MATVTMQTKGLGTPEFWAEQLEETANAFYAFLELDDLDSMTAAFEAVLDAAWGMVMEQYPGHPLTPTYRRAVARFHGGPNRD